MDEIVQIVVEKTGLSEEMARKAVDAVLEVVKDKLPAPIAAQVDGFLSGDAAEGLGGLGNMAKGLGGLFGK